MLTGPSLNCHVVLMNARSPTHEDVGLLYLGDQSEGAYGVFSCVSQPARMTTAGQSQSCSPAFVPSQRFGLSFPLIAWRTGCLAVGVALVSTVGHSDDVVLDSGSTDAVRSSDLALVAIAFEYSLAARSVFGAARACA